MPCVLQHFVSILCYSQWVLHVHVQNSEKKRMEARTMLGSCCIHDRPDIDTYLAYLDMYTDSYIHIYMCIYIYIFISIYIYMWLDTHTHAHIYIYTYISIYIFINSRQSEISRPTGKHISDTAPPQTQPHLWRKITTCLTSHHNIIAAPPQTQPHDHVHRTKMHEFPGAVLDDVSKKKAVVKAAERHLAWALAFATLSAMLSCNIGTACPNFYVATSLDARTYWHCDWDVRVVTHWKKSVFHQAWYYRRNLKIPLEHTPTPSNTPSERNPFIEVCWIHQPWYYCRKPW